MSQYLSTLRYVPLLLIISLLQDLKDINAILQKVFLLMPQYCLGRGLFDMAKNQLFADVYARLGMSISALQCNVFKGITLILTSSCY